jgi:hypothetical protein
MSTYTEDHLVEQPAIQLMQDELGWEVVGCYGEWDGGASVLGRDGKREVVLVSRLCPALQRLNPDLPMEAIEGAVEEKARSETLRLRPAARRFRLQLRRSKDATATFCWTMGSICALRDSDIPCNWNL